MTLEWKFTRNTIFVFVALAVAIAVWFAFEVQAFSQGYPHRRFTHEKIVEQFIESLESGSSAPLEKVSGHPDCRDQVQRDMEEKGAKKARKFTYPMKAKNYEFSVAESNHEDEDYINLSITTEEGEKLLFSLFAKIKGFPGKQYLCHVSGIPG